MFRILIILAIRSINLSFSWKIIILINTFLYPFIEVFLFFAEIYSPGMAFL